MTGTETDCRLAARDRAEGAAPRRQHGTGIRVLRRNNNKKQQLAALFASTGAVRYRSIPPIPNGDYGMSDPATKPAKPKRQCPKGHPVRKAFGTFYCSSALCGEDLQAMAGGAKQVNEAALAKADPAEIEAATRLSMAKVPANLKGDEAVKWSQDKMVELLPEAVANIAWNLRFGTAKERAEATDKVLRANGMDRRDQGVQTGGLIVLNLNGGKTDIPWLQRVQPSRPVVETLTQEEGDE